MDFLREFNELKKEIAQHVSPVEWANEQGRSVGIYGVSVKGKQPDKPWSAGQDDELDAFRHAYMNALSIAWGRTVTFDSEWIERFVKDRGEKHEQGRGECAATLDLHNNKVGRLLAPDRATMIRWLQAGESPQKEIARIVANAIRAGEMITSYDDPRMPKACHIQTKKKGKYYVWRTLEDDDVRWQHAVRNGRVFAWEKRPLGGHPGEDYGCRCVAEPLDEKFEDDFDEVFKK